jgi:hypothetical protein
VVSGLVGCLFDSGYGVGIVCVVILLIYYIGLVYYYDAVLCYVNVLSYFMTVSEIYFNVLVYSLFVADYLICFSLDAVIFGFGVGMLVVVWVFFSFFSVLRAFSSWTYLARISSSFSTSRSPSCGSKTI